MSYGRYPDISDCGIDWLGDIPSPWNTKRLKHLFRIQKRIAGELGHEVLAITQKGIRKKDTESGEGQLSMDYSKYQIVHVGDFAMNHMDLLTGWVDISAYEGVTSPDYRVFEMAEKEAAPRYFLYLLQMGYTSRVFYAHGQGSSHLGRWRFPTESFKEFWFPFPSLNEQTTIADFLDRETAKIDTLIEKQERLIELLEEKRQAVITRAVTKGLNPDVRMKDSGVEWLGEAPEYWAVLQLKHVATFQRGHDLPSEKRVPGEYPVVTSGGVGETHETAAALGPAIVTGRYGTIGEFYLVEDDFWPLNTTLYTTDIHGNQPRYLWYMLQGVRHLFVLHSQKSAVPGVDRNDVHREHVAISIDPNEQAAISARLDDLSATVSRITDRAENAIRLLRERRTALISAAVTGKIDVRNVV